jgi:hypothetical protein
MPRPRIDMRKIREVLRLALGEELSRRQVAAASGVPLTTVNDYLRRAAAAGLKWPLPGDLDDAGLEALLYPPAAPSVVARPVPDWQRVHKELRRKGVTLQLLWVEYREAHPDGYGYSQFANLYRAWRGSVDVTMRQVHVAGEKLFVDFPGDTVPVWDRRAGEVALRAELFVAVMGASNYLYAEAFPSQELLYWVTAHVHCFEALGGCPLLPARARRRPVAAGRQRPADGMSLQGIRVLPGRAAQRAPASRPVLVLPGAVPGGRRGQGISCALQRARGPDHRRPPPGAARRAARPASRAQHARGLTQGQRQGRRRPRSG